METSKSQFQNTESFDFSPQEETIAVREFDPSTAEVELRMRFSEVRQRVNKLEKSQEISQDFLESVISI